MNIGIIGLGRFGTLLAKTLQPHATIYAHDLKAPKSLEGVHFSSLKETVEAADILFILVPISYFENSCIEIQPYLSPNTLIVDCCSVKIHPVQIMKKVFSKEQPIIATHPLFGPDSVQKTGKFQSHKIVVCPIQANEQQKQTLISIFETLGLKIFICTPEEHDKEMAYSQGLVHFIGRGLESLDLKPQEIATPDFQALLNINHMVVHDTRQLFLDMHRYNPYTQRMRKKLIEQMIKLDQEISTKE